MAKSAKGSIEYCDSIIEYTIDRAKRKHLYICVNNGEVIVKSPLKTDDKDIEKAILSKGKWILEKISTTLAKKIRPIEYTEGEIFCLLGESYRLKLYYKNIRRVTLEVIDNYFSVTLPLALEVKENGEQRTIYIQRVIDKYYKQIAIKEVTDSINKMSSLTGLVPAKVSIKKLTRSWGRCSSNRNISINKDIVTFSRDVIDYVVLHELCHLKHMNHSKAFWNLVENYMPEYKRWYNRLKGK